MTCHMMSHDVSHDVLHVPHTADSRVTKHPTGNCNLSHVFSQETCNRECPLQGVAINHALCMYTQSMSTEMSKLCGKVIATERVSCGGLGAKETAQTEVT